MAEDILDAGLVILGIVVSLATLITAGIAIKGAMKDRLPEGTPRSENELNIRLRQIWPDKLIEDDKEARPYNFALDVISALEDTASLWETYANHKNQSTFFELKKYIADNCGEVYLLKYDWLQKFGNDIKVSNQNVLIELTEGERNRLRDVYAEIKFMKEEA